MRAEDPTPPPAGSGIVAADAPSLPSDPPPALEAAWLLAATEKLADADTDDAVAEIAVRAVTDTFGIDSAALWVLDEHTTRARLIRHVGDAAALLGRAHDVALDEEHPLAEALRSRAPQWSRAPEPCFAVLPVLSGARVLGALALAGSGERGFVAGERALLDSLSRQCAQAMDRVRLRRREQTTAHRLARLQELTAALSSAARVEDVARVATELACKALGVASAALWTVEPWELRLRASHEIPAEVMMRWRAIARDSASPAARIARSGVAEWAETEADYVASSAEIAAHSRETGRLHAYAALPLTSHDETLAVVAFGYAEWRRFDEAERAFMSTVASHAAQALQRARLFESEERARVRVERLQTVIAALSNARTRAEVADAACRVGSEVAGAASGAMWALEASGDLSLVGAWGTPAEFIQQFQHLSANDRDAPAVQAAHGREPTWIEDEESFARAAPAIYPVAKAAGRIAAFGALPLVASGDVRGVIVFSHPMPHRYDDGERSFYVALAQHCAHAMERASLLEAERRLYDAAQAAAHRAESANRMKDEFLATVSHELRTPLNAITGWVRMLRAGAVSEGRREHALAVIERNAAAQEQLIADLLDMSRVISGRLRLSVDRVSIASVIGMAVEAVRPTAEKRDVTLSTALDADVDDLIGDADRLQQILWNLLMNAVKFTRAGGRVDVALTQESPYVVVRVTDTGQGIRHDFLPHVFEPFRQADASFARRHGGLGLGLAIARTLVEMHGGTIDAASEGEGLGATFTVRLPMATLRPESTPRVPALAPVREDAGALSSLAGLTILVVEDEPDSRELVMALLEARGASVLGAANADEALEKLARAEPSAIVSDVGLPGEDGLSLIRRVRARPGATRVPAIALSAFVRDEDRARALEAGFDRHVRKPIDPEELLTTIAEAVDGRPRVE